MLDKIKHVNCKNEVLDFNVNKIYLNYNNLRDYEWKVSSTNNKISGFSKGIVEKTLPFIIYCSEDEANSIKNKFYNHFEKDVVSNKKGYFIINGYKYSCYVTKSKKTNYLISKGLLYVELGVVSDVDYWIKEKTYILDTNKEISKDEKTNKRYRYKYPYTYRGLKDTLQITNDSVGECDVIIRMFGACANPFVKIGETVYQINASLENGEYFEINTENKTVYKVGMYGERTNYFMHRNMDRANFFLKIKEGANLLSWSGFEKGEIVLVEKRSEPIWM